MHRLIKAGACAAAATAACLGSATVASAQAPTPYHDLVLTQADISPASPLKNQDVTVTIGVRNDGNVREPATYARFKPDAGGAAAQLARVPALTPGSSAVVTIKTKYKQAGNFTSTAEVDAYDRVKEQYPATENDLAPRFVTVTANTTPVDVDIDHLLVLNDLDDDLFNYDGEWDDVVLFVYDPTQTCHYEVSRGPIHIDQTFPSVGCLHGGDGEVNDEDDTIARPGVGVRTHLEPGIPVVAALTAFENDDPLAPDVPGYATFVSPYPKYRTLPGPVQVAGKGCTKVSATGGTTPVDGGHCFDAFFKVSLPLGLTGGGSAADVLNSAQAQTAGRAAVENAAAKLRANVKALGGGSDGLTVTASSN